MSFLETIHRARTYLEEHGRVSLRALKREFDLDEDALEELVEELRDVQQVATLHGNVLAWGCTTTSSPSTRAAASAARSAGEAERRQLTVMFCDLVGSTELSQRLDAEDLRTVVRAYQESAAVVIERYAGHIAQYLGDGLLVYFGYPHAHEDDAERAVRAGREILTALGVLNETLEREHGLRLATRVGIHTGPVVVGAMGSGDRIETLALGDTTNIAARLQGVAEPGALVASGATIRLVPGLFLTRDLGVPSLAGVAEPVRAHQVLRPTGVRSRLDVDPDRLTPLVGRDQEIGLLLDRWEQVQEGEGQSVLISGEAGLGKSRLLHTFRERVAAEAHTWLECRCSPYTQGSAFHPPIELVEQSLDFKPGDDAAARLRRLERGLANAGLPEGKHAPFLASLLSLPDGRDAASDLGPEVQRLRTIEALVAWVLAVAAEQPLVMLFEDLHWADSSTVELLGELLRQNPAARVLTLLTFRPDFEPPWPARSHVTTLAVKRLSRRQARSMVGAVSREVPLPEPLVDRIVERADGVPLFVEELTKTVLESDQVVQRGGRWEIAGDTTALAIPTTLHDSLRARLDRLPLGKRTAQIGAAIGREFRWELLHTVAPGDHLDASLAQLVDAEILYQRGVPPTATYTFKHALIQEAAYESLLKRARQELHGRIAEVLEAGFPERVEAEPEMIARHHDRAGHTAKAITHYRRAGERATRDFANPEAIRHLRRTLELLATEPPSPERARRELELQMAIAAPLSAAAGWSDPACERAAARARELAYEIGEVPELSRVLAGLSVSYCVKCDLVTASEVAREALALAERTGEPRDLMLAHSAAGPPLLYQGEYTRALHHLEKAIALAGPNRGVVLRINSAWCQWTCGHPDRALATTEEAVALARRVGNPLGLASGLATAGYTHFLRRDPERTVDLCTEAVAICRERGFPLYLGLALCYLGWAHAALGDGERGVDVIREGLTEMTGIKSGVGAPILQAMLAECLRTAGRDDEALDTVAHGLALAAETRHHSHNAELHRLRAEILLAQDPPATAEAERELDHAVSVAHSQDARSLELRAACSLARHWHLRGKKNEARALLRPVYNWFTEGFDTRDLQDAKALLRELE